MRLTLRTLLAYLDDILPPAETKELGEKIAASPVASQLVDRIREVMRRRRLTAPETDGSGGGIEPNLVAEYLDNSLPPERVTDVERVCLESDVNLAEVAACHQVLTLVLGEPVEVPARLRERMYALGPQGTPVDVPEPPPASKNVREATAREQLAAIQSAQQPKPAAAARPTAGRVPDYLRTPLWRRALPWMIVPLLLLACVALYWNDPTIFPGAGKPRKGDAGRAERAEKDGLQANAADARASEEPATTDETSGAAAVVADVPEPPVDPEPPAEALDDAEPPVAATQTEPAGDAEPAAEAVAAARPDGPMPPVASETSATGSTTLPATGEPPVAAAGSAPQLGVVPGDAVVLRADPESGQWFPLKAGETPPPGAGVAVPAPFRAELTVAGLPLRFSAVGGTRLSAFGKTDAAEAGIDVTQGRLRVLGDAATDPGQMMFALRLGPGLWRVEPLTADTVLGLEALPLQPSAEGQDLSGRTPQGVVYVAAGTARVVDASGRVEVASAGNRLILAPSAGSGAAAPAGPPAAAGDPPAEEAAAPPAAADSATPGSGAEGGTAAATGVEPLSPLGLPDWMAMREPTTAARRGMAALKAEFIPDAPAVASLLPAVKSRNYNIAEPAAQALGLIENADGLVRTLRDTEHPEAALAAIDGLRNWLGRSPANGEELRRLLEGTFGNQGLADTLERLLWGYGPEDARDPVVSSQLVDWLLHPEPSVRELAFYHVKRLSGRTFDYNPRATQGQRAGAVNLWKGFLARQGALVPAE